MTGRRRLARGMADLLDLEQTTSCRSRGAALDLGDVARSPRLFRQRPARAAAPIDRLRRARRARQSLAFMNASISTSFVPYSWAIAETSPFASHLTSSNQLIGCPFALRAVRRAGGASSGAAERRAHRSVCGGSMAATVGQRSPARRRNQSSTGRVPAARVRPSPARSARHLLAFAHLEGAVPRGHLQKCRRTRAWA